MSSVGTYHHGNLRDALVIAARGVLKDHGLSSLTLRATARAAGVSHMAPYNHFSDKRALLAALADLGFTELDARCERAGSAGTDTRTSLQRVGQAYVEFALDQPEMFQLMFSSEVAGMKRDRHESSAPVTNVYGRMQGLVSGMVSDTDARQGDVEAACIGAWSLVHGLATLLIEGRIAVPERRRKLLIKRVTQQFADSLGKQPG